MNSPERPTVPYEAITCSIVEELNYWKPRNEQFLKWGSIDGEYNYVGRRTRDLETGQIQWNDWRLIAISRDKFNEGDIVVDGYCITGGKKMRAVECVLPGELWNERPVGEILNNEIELQKELDIDETEPIDYAKVDNAIADLMLIFRNERIKNRDQNGPHDC